MHEHRPTSIDSKGSENSTRTKTNEHTGSGDLKNSKNSKRKQKQNNATKKCTRTFGILRILRKPKRKQCRNLYNTQTILRLLAVPKTKKTRHTKIPNAPRDV